MIKPIPLKLLGHTIEIDGQEIKRVRVEPNNRIFKDIYGESIESKYLIFIDSVNSVGDLTLLENGKRIRFESIEMTIIDIQKLIEYGDKVHHLEVICN